MGDHEMIHAAAPAMYNISTASNGSAGNWWNTAVPPVSCSTDLAGFSSWSALAATCDMVDANKSRTTTTASSESPGSNSLSNNSSVTFQEPTSIADPAGIAVPPQSGFGEWSHPFLNISSSGLHGFLQDGHHDMSSRTDQNSMNKAALMNPSSNDLILQGHHEQDHGQLLSNLGSELLLSPTSPYGLQSSLLRSLMDPTPPAKPLPVFQQYQHQHQQMNQTPAARFAAAAASTREPLQFINETPFWNPSVGFATVATEGASLGVVKPSPAPRTTNLAMKTALEGVGDSSSIVTKKASAEPAFKKPRIEATSPLPTFKVRKEKLGDRITALQQLVSPFGKTDTASVLHETIDYIKFLHDQVGALSAPYLKNGHQVPHLKSSTDKTKDSELSLKGRGLCLVPISSTFAVASEVPVDFWAPFGATFR